MDRYSETVTKVNIAKGKGEVGVVCQDLFLSLYEDYERLKQERDQLEERVKEVKYAAQVATE